RDACALGAVDDVRVAGGATDGLPLFERDARVRGDGGVARLLGLARAGLGVEHLTRGTRDRDAGSGLIAVAGAARLGGLRLGDAGAAERDEVRVASAARALGEARVLGAAVEQALVALHVAGGVGLLEADEALSLGTPGEGDETDERRG